MGSPGKRVCRKRYRGFESLPVRHFLFFFTSSEIGLVGLRMTDFQKPPAGFLKCNDGIQDQRANKSFVVQSRGEDISGLNLSIEKIGRR